MHLAAYRPLLTLVLAAALGAALPRAATGAEPPAGIDQRFRQGQLTPHVFEAPLPGHFTSPEAAARAFFAQYRSTFALTRPATEIVLTRVVPLAGGHTVVAGERRLDGLPVQGRGFRLLLSEGDPRLLFLGNLDPVVALPERHLLLPDAATAVEAALDHLKHSSLRGAPRARQVVVAHPGSSRLAWELALPLVGPRGLGDLTVLLDAATGGLLGATPALRPAQGQVYLTNPEVSELAIVELRDLDPGATTLMGAWARVQSASFSGNRIVAASQAEADEDGNFIFQPTRLSGRNDPFAEVHAYYHVNQIHSVFAGLGLDPELLQRLLVYVNIDELDNAYYSEADGGIFFGDSARDFVYDADVLYHEYTHAVVDKVVDLEPYFDYFGFDHFPLAVNEGTADAWSTQITGDPVLGEYIGYYDGAIRVMDGDASCPQDLQGESHHDGLLWGQSAWEIRTLLGPEEHARFMWGVLNLLSPAANFTELAESASRFARRNYEDDVAAQIREVLERRNLFTCERVIPLESSGSHSGVAYSAVDLFQGQMRMDLPASLLYSFVVPCGATRLVVDVDAESLMWGGVDFQLLARKGRAVSFDYNERTGDLTPEADQVSDTGRLTIRNPESGSWFFSLLVIGDGSFSYTISPTAEFEPGGSQLCACVGGLEGVSQCQEDGTWSPCECAGGEGEGEGEGGEGGGEGEGEGGTGPRAGAGRNEGCSLSGSHATSNPGAALGLGSLLLVGLLLRRRDV